MDGWMDGWMAIVCYGIAAGFFRLAKAMDPPNTATGIFYSVFILIYWVLALVDSCLLVASVLTTEIVAFALFILSSLFANCDMAKRWHQYVRRTCHLLRWAFRSKAVSSYPPRHLCCAGLAGEKLQSETNSGKEDDQWTIGRVEIDEKWTQAKLEPEQARPSAPPSTEDVIILDERDVIVEDQDGNSDGSGKE